MKVREAVAGVTLAAGLTAASLVMTNMGPSATAAPVFATTHPGPTPVTYTKVHGYDHSTVRVVVTAGDTKQVFHSERAAMDAVEALNTGSGPGGCYGNYTVSLSRIGRSLLGFKLYGVHESLNFGYDCLAHYVNVIGQSKSWDVYDGTWKWEGWVGSKTFSNQYAWQSGWPNSGHSKKATGEFSGPCISTSITCHPLPWVWVKAHADGSNWTDTGEN